MDGSPVLRVLSAGLTSARSLDRPRLGGLSGLTPEPDGSPLFTSSLSVTCQRYEPRKCPDPLAMARYRDAAFPVERSGRPLRSRSILLRCPAGWGYHSVHLRSGLQPPCLRFAVADTTQDSVRGCPAQALPRSPSQATELNALARRNPLRTGHDDCPSSGSSLCRPVPDPHVVSMMAPPVYQLQVVDLV